MRDQIIAEIQRISQELGRVPGIAVFEQATGIPRREVIGKIWARWSEAVAAAGLQANSFDRERYGEAAILRYIAEACLSIGRWPSPNDLRIHARQNPGFPSTKTIENHFPKRILLVEAMRSWAGSTTSFQGVVDLLPQSVPKEPAPNVQASGYVYLIRSGEFYKIGRSDQVERRIKEIRIALPEAAVLEHVIATDDPSGIESYWHRRFADHRMNGEWFKLTKTDIFAFKKRKFQ